MAATENRWYLLIWWVAMLLISILIWCVLGLLGGWVAARKGYPPRIGIVVAFVFGPTALLVFLVLPATKAGREQAEIESQISKEAVDQGRIKSCPNCRRDVSFTCRVCPRCEHRFDSMVT